MSVQLLRSNAAHPADLLRADQKRVFHDAGLGEGAGAVVLAPTGWGKSHLADATALAMLGAGRGVLYLVPTRSLARERARQLARLAGPAGWRVALSTREERGDDEAIRAGQVDVAVMVYEKARALLLASVPARRAWGLVVADEAHLLEDEERGPAALEFLRLWRAEAPAMQVLAMTAAGRDPRLLAARLGLPLHVVEGRAVPLRRGEIDAAAGVARWHCPESGESGEIALGAALDMAEESADEATAGQAMAQWSAALEGPVLWFVPTRRLARQLAHAMAEARPTVAPGGDGRMAPLLARRVAYHSTDLTRAERTEVEDALRAGALDACVATTTLAEGVNLGVRTVVVVNPEHWCYQLPLENLLGRAGRPGQERGWALTWSLEGKAEGEAGRGAFVPSAAPEARRRALVEAVAVGIRGRGGVAAIGEVGPAAGENAAAVIDEGARMGLWSAEPDGDVLRLAPAGELVALAGVDPAAAAAWRTILRRFPAGGGPAAQFFLALGSGTLARPVGLAADDRLSGRWPLELARWMAGDASELAAYFRGWLAEPEGLPRRTHEAAKAVMICRHLLAGGDWQSVEQEFAVPAGLAEELLSHALFLVQQLRQLGRMILGRDLPTAGIPEELPPPPSAPPAGAARVVPLHTPAPRPALRLVLRRGTTGIAILDGNEVRLTRLQFRLLELLARNAGEGVVYERIEQYLWPDAQVERQQVSFHRANLEKKLRLASRDGKPLIETLATWGLRLCLEPREVTIEVVADGLCHEDPAEEAILKWVAREVCV
jgi:DNA-binding winged helix-turn-helix (wHTH) protein